MQLAARTGNRVSNPRAQYASRAIPATIPNSRGRQAILLLVLAPPSAHRHARLWLNIHRRLVRLGALPVHRDIDRGSVDPGVLGPTSFSATLRVRVRHQRRSEPELRLRLPVRARDCRGELMLRLCTPSMSYEDGMILILSTTLARLKSATLRTGRLSCARSTFYGIESVSEESGEKTQPRRRTSGLRSRCAMPELEGRDHRVPLVL